MRACLLLLLAMPAFGGYSYIRTVTIDHTKVQSSDQSNFPVLINGTFTYLKTSGNGGKVQNTATVGPITAPTDLIFTSDSACQTKLSWEVDEYVASSGVLVAWVKIATVSHTTDTVFYMCYDNSAVTTWQGNVTDTWSNGYISVWHENNNAATTAITDSLGANAGTLNGSTTAAHSAVSQIGHGMTSTGTDNIWINTTYSHPTTGFTASGWGNSAGGSTAFNRLFGSASADGTTGMAGLWEFSTNANMYAVFRSGVNTNTHDIDAAASGIATGWHYQAITLANPGGGILYYDGASIGTNAITAVTVAQNYLLGNSGNINVGHNFTGIQDEQHFANVVRSADWIKTEYNNQFAPSTFTTMGAETGVGIRHRAISQ